MPRVLITGSTGFVGSHTVETFVNAGWTVRAMIRDPRRRCWPKDYPIEIAIGTLTDRVSLDSAIQGCDTVVHCAALTKARGSEEYFRINAAATGELALAARNHGVQRFVFCSTQAAAGPSSKDRPTIESDPPRPISHYGRSKLEGERLVREHSGEMEWMIIRPPSVLGPRDEQFVPLFRAVVRYGIYPEFGRGGQRYSYIGVLDLARALLTAATAQNGLNEIYFVANPDSVEWREMAADIGRIAGRNVRPVHLNSVMLTGLAYLMEGAAALRGKPALLSREKITEIKASGWICSADKIYRTWGFECRLTREEVLRITYEAYRRQHLL